MSDSRQVFPTATNPEERMQQRIAELERSVRDLRRAATAAPQRASDEVAANVQTNASSYVALTGGPSVSVEVQPNQMVMIAGMCDVFNPAGGGASFWGLYEATDFSSTVISGAGVTFGFNDVASTWKRNQNPRAEVTAEQIVPWTDSKSSTLLPTMLAYYPTPGTRTYEMRYGKQGSFTNNAQFENRKLWVVVI